MKITVFIVAYNEEAYLPRLMEDLKKQTYPHDRIRVILEIGRASCRERV